MPHIISSALCLLLATGLVSAAETNMVMPEIGPDESETVTYPAGFFDRYRPVNALDMVENLPGFRLNDGGSSRGFGATAGNVLLNSKRPSSKQDRVSSLLERIPAAQVERIDLIRGETGSLSVGEQTVVADVILSKDGGATLTWEALVELDLDRGGPEPGGSLSMVTRSGATRYGAGIQARHYFIGNRADEVLLGSDRTLETRDEFERYRGNDLSLNFNTETDLTGALVHFNAEIEYGEQDFRERSTRTPTSTPASAHDVNRTSIRDEWGFEFGGDIEWAASDSINAKAIALFGGELEDRNTGLEILDADGHPDRRQRALTETFDSETIARIELDWTGWTAHHVELDVEAALNVLDNELELMADEAGSGFEQVPVPNADLRVEEQRADLALSDSWHLGPITIEPELGAEASRISQSGEGAPPRSFFFLKPALAITHAPEPSRQIRFQLSRDVAQLDFSNFVSSANFGDEDIDLGNPELEPETTWTARLSHERRFGRNAAATVSVFYDRVSDTQDLLPVGDGFEVPGNIGDGRRFGVELESSLPLGPLGLKGGRLDIDGRWQDSSVRDPVTGHKRPFSSERDTDISARLRQDLPELRWAWGLESRYLSSYTRFELNELDTIDQGVDLEAFVETTRFGGMKMRLVAQNLLNREFLRDRRVYTASRGDGELAFRELRDRRRGRSVILTINGSF